MNARTSIAVLVLLVGSPVAADTSGPRHGLFRKGPGQDRVYEAPPPKVPDAPPPITTPTRLRSTADPQECTAQAGLGAGILCADAAEKGLVVLLWDWNPARPDERIDGYRLYRVKPSAGKASSGAIAVPQRPVIVGGDPASSGWVDPTKQLVKAISDPGVRAVTIDDKPGAGTCFRVLAFRGGDESFASDAFCLDATAKTGIETMKLTPTKVEKFYKRNSGKTGTQIGIGDDPGSDSCGTAVAFRAHAGFCYKTTKAWDTDTFDNTLLRSGILFDVGALQGRNVRGAVLSLHVGGRTVTGNCGDGVVGAATSNWWLPMADGKSQPWTEGDYIGGFPLEGDLDVAVDVTQQVREWAAGEANNGFILKSEGERLDAFMNGTCSVGFDAVGLAVDLYR